MSDSPLEDVGARLTRTVQDLIERDVIDAEATDDELFDHYEQLAIQLLDSEWQSHREGILESYLRGFLDGVRVKNPRRAAPKSQKVGP